MEGILPKRWQWWHSSWFLCLKAAVVLVEFVKEKGKILLALVM
jgi:hypothetical protein